MSEMSVDQIDLYLPYYFGLPPDVVSKFKQIAWQGVKSFQTFYLSIQSDTGSIETYVGAAKNVNGLVTLAFTSSKGIGKIHQRKNCENAPIFLLPELLKHFTYNNIMFSYADAFISRSIKCFHEVICQERFETCVPYFFVLENLCIPREYAVPEHLDNCSNYNINHNIKESLLTENSDKKFKLSSFTGLIASQAVERTELLRRVISARFAELPETRKRVEQFFPNIPNSENYIHGTGFKSFSESTGLIKWLGIMDSKIPEFLDYILSSIKLVLIKRRSISK